MHAEHAEHEFAQNGIAYAASDSQDGEGVGLGCRGCAFDQHGCMALSHPCLFSFRADRRKIVWKRKLETT